MARNFNDMPFWFILMIVFLLSCSDTSNKTSLGFESRKEIARQFSKVSVFRDNEEYIYLNTYKGKLQNEYVFYSKGARLFRDEAFFSPDSILEINKENLNGEKYEKSLVEKLSKFLKKMDSLHIRNVTSEFFSQGIDIKLYMKSNAIYVYVSDSNAVTNPQWVDYLKRMKKLDDNWYYSRQNY